jgi:hypothetical protein
MLEWEGNGMTRSYDEGSKTRIIRCRLVEDVHSVCLTFKVHMPGYYSRLVLQHLRLHPDFELETVSSGLWSINIKTSTDDASSYTFSWHPRINLTSTPEVVP